MNQKGFSLVEVIVASAISILAIAAVTAAYRRLSSQVTSLSEQNRAELNLAEAYALIMKVGRISNACAKSTTTPSTLECDLNFTVPAIEGTPLTKVRFGLTGTDLKYEVQDAGVWKTRRTFQNVKEFTICDDADMSGSTCAIRPSMIGDRHAANKLALSGATTDDIFFRFRLAQIISKRTSAQVALQGAFTLRKSIIGVGGGAAAIQWGLGDSS